MVGCELLIGARRSHPETSGAGLHRWTAPLGATTTYRPLETLSSGCDRGVATECENLNEGVLLDQPRTTRICRTERKKAVKPRPMLERDAGHPSVGAGAVASGPGNGPCSASNVPLTAPNASSARSRVARSCVAMTLVRSSAPPGGTAGCRATLT
jgi:hypothetical protein